MRKPRKIFFSDLTSSCSTRNLKTLSCNAIKSHKCKGCNMRHNPMKESINLYITFLKCWNTFKLVFLWNKIPIPYVVSYWVHVVKNVLEVLIDYALDKSLQITLLLNNSACSLTFIEFVIFSHLHFTLLNWSLRSTMSSASIYSYLFARINTINFGWSQFD